MPGRRPKPEPLRRAADDERRDAEPARHTDRAADEELPSEDEDNEPSQQRQPCRRASPFERRTGADLPGPAPLVRFTTTDPGKYRIEVTVFCPDAAADRLQNEITWEVVERLQPEQAGAEAEGARAEAPHARTES